jgi:SAM-dependent methyltransferase
MTVGDPSATIPDTYDAGCFERLAAIEDRHFWFVNRARVIEQLVREITRHLPNSPALLEVGCGNGTLLCAIARACPRVRVMGMDLFSEGLARAQHVSGCPLVRGDIFLPPFAQRLDLIGMFDVLEHLENDIEALTSVRTMLSRGGSLLLTVPAHPALWSYFDEYSCHKRRYTITELTQKLAATGYEVTYATEYMCSLLPLLWISRNLARALTFRKRDSAADLAGTDLKVVPVLNEIIGWSIAWEARFITRRRRLPFGASIIAVAKAT